MNKYNKIKNIKIGLYEEDGNTYMSLEGTTKVGNGNAIFNLQKIDISQMEFFKNTVSEYIQISYDKKPIYHYIDCYVKFPVIPVDDVLITTKIIEKEMTLNEIEKELGYKIKIKN